MHCKKICRIRSPFYFLQSPNTPAFYLFLMIWQVVHPLDHLYDLLRSQGKGVNYFFPAPEQLPEVLLKYQPRGKHND